MADEQRPPEQRLMADEQHPPESSRRRVGFQFPWSAFVHYPQRTDPQDLSRTPSPDSPADSTADSPPGSPRASPTRTPRARRRRRRALKRFDAERLIVSFLMLSTVVIIIGTWMYISSSRKAKDVHDAEPWAFWRLRKHDRGIPRILLWDSIKKSFSYNASSEIEVHWSSNITECPFEEGRSPIVECEITDNRSRFEWSDAVVFEANRLSMYDLPRIWPRFPMWVLWARTHLSPDSEFTHNIYSYTVRTRFNWTMGRREDADIVVPYKSWRCGVRGDAMVAETAERNRKELNGSVRAGHVAWISGMCEKEAYRQVREMAKHSGDDQSGRLGVRHIDIGMFDECGRGTCATPLECVRRIATNYKFIVVRMHPDCFHSPYELIYEAFEYDLVPVVLAPPNTTLNVPPHSVVNSENIQKPGQLAAFLGAIMDHPSEYQRYFAWKKQCSLIPNRVDLCPLCQALYERFARRQAHPDAYEWWMARSLCPVFAPPLYGLDWAFSRTDEPWL